MQINIPELPRSPYGLLVMSAVAIGFVVAVLFMRRFKVAKETIFYTCLLTLVCTLFGAILMEFKFTSEGIQLGFSGLGAVVGMALGIFISSLIMRDKPECIMASFVVAAPLMYGLAKFGCLFAGCCHGKDYTGPFALVYTGVHAGSYFPTQFIDMASFILIHILAVILVTKLRNKLKAIYIIISITLPVRFVLEYLRYYHNGSFIAPQQITVLIAGALSVTILIIWQKALKINYR